MEILKYFNSMDIVLFVIALFAAIYGASKGFISNISNVLGYFLGFFCSFCFTKALTPHIKEFLNWPYWLLCGFSFVILFLATYIGISLLGKVFVRVMNSSNIGFLDGILGFFLSMYEFIIIVGIIISILQKQNSISFGNLFTGSFFYTRIIEPCFGLIQKTVNKLC